jgi:hypothetical protein
MTLMSQIVDAVIADVTGYTATIDTSTYTTGSLTNTTLTIPVNDASAFSRGIIEIENELIWVDSVDRVAKTLTVASTAMRGIRGTTAASHASGVRVIMSPSVPRIQAISAVEQTLRSAPGLFTTGSGSITYAYGQLGYDIAAASAKIILSVSWQPSLPSIDYQPVKRWTHDRYNDQLVIEDYIQPGATVKYVYTKDVTVPVQSADFTTSGLPATCEDVVRFGAAWRLLSFVEPTNMFTRAAEADAMDKNIQPANRLQIAKYLYQMYRQRLDEEVAALNLAYPVRQHFGG